MATHLILEIMLGYTLTLLPLPQLLINFAAKSTRLHRQTVKIILNLAGVHFCWVENAIFLQLLLEFVFLTFSGERGAGSVYIGNLLEVPIIDRGLHVVRLEIVLEILQGVVEDGGGGFGGGVAGVEARVEVGLVGGEAGKPTLPLLITSLSIFLNAQLVLLLQLPVLSRQLLQIPLRFLQLDLQIVDNLLIFVHFLVEVGDLCLFFA